MVMFIFVVIIFLANIYNGIQNGAILQIVRLAGAVVSIWIASMYYLPLAKQLGLLIPYPGLTLETSYAYFPESALYEMDQVFFRLVAFIIIIFLVRIVFGMVAYIFKGLKFMPIPKFINFIVGIFSGVTITWIGFFFFFAFLSLLAIEPVQNFLANSATADFFMLRTPYLSSQLISQLFTGIGSI